MLCDEPTGALDAKTGKLVLAVLDQVNRETGTTTAIITHNVAIGGLGDRVIRMIRLDRLRVEGFLPVRTARRELEGSPVRLSIEHPGRPTAQYTGKLIFVSPEVDPVNDQVRVFADIENPDLTLRPGLRGSLVIEFSGRR